MVYFSEVFFFNGTNELIYKPKTATDVENKGERGERG